VTDITASADVERIPAQTRSVDDPIDPTFMDDTSPPDPRRWLALGIIAIAQLMIVLDGTVVNIALPLAANELGISAENRHWAVTAYTLTFGGLLLLGGRIADYVGRKKVFIIGLLGFAGASALGGLTPNQELLFASRGLQGLFAALLAPAALALLTVTFTKPKERATAFGVFGAISGDGAAIGLILGGALTQYADWRWCLGINVPIAIGTALAAAAVVHESKAHGDTRYDVPGAVLATLGLVSLVYGFTEAAKRDVGWTGGSTLAYLGAAAVLLVAFLVVETRVKNPLLPLRVLTDRNRGGSYLTFLFLAAGLFAMFLFLTFYFQVVLGYSPLKSGFAFLPFSLGIIFAAGLVAKLLPVIGPRPLIATGLTMATVGMFLLTQLDPGSSYTWGVLPSLIIISVGLAGVFIPTSSTALHGVSGHDAGVASALLNTSQQVGASLGLALLNTLYTSAVADYMDENQLSMVKSPFGLLEPAEALTHGYTVAFFWGAVMFVIALVLSVVFINARKEDVPADGGMVHA
jgi:EmrB/QacA subfamily drug resistance transporter